MDLTLEDHARIAHTATMPLLQDDDPSNQVSSRPKLFFHTHSVSGDHPDDGVGNSKEPRTFWATQDSLLFTMLRKRRLA